MNILEVRNLTKKFGDFEAVRGVDFSVAQGEIFGFLGPNGAGKTTTINMLTGLARITSGNVSFLGDDYTQNVKKAQHLMGIVADESNLYDELSGFENLCFCAALYGMKKKDRENRARQLLDQFGLADVAGKSFKAYSKGMKRKLTIAAGIIHNPKLLFLDEPTTGIDVASARQIRRLLTELNKNGTTIFLTTHYIEEAERLCHRIAFIVKGKIVRIGSGEELMSEAQKYKIVQFTVSKGADEILQEIGEAFKDINVEIVGPDTVRIISDYPVNLIPFIDFFHRNGLEVYEAKIVRPSLEEVFVKVTGVDLEQMKKEKERGKK